MAAKLSAVVDGLNAIAPLELAEEWDNVGLLIEPSRPRPVRRILLTIDLTDAVLDEAIAAKVEMIVAYHPPIFEPFKRLGSGGGRRITRLIENRIAVYCPHTALDSVHGGVNDWLADAFGEEGSSHIRVPIKPIPIPHQLAAVPSRFVKIVVFVPTQAADRLRQALGDAGIGWIGGYSHCSFNVEGEGTFFGREGTHPRVGKKGRLERVKETRIEMITDQDMLLRTEHVIRKNHPYEEPAYEFYPLVRPGPPASATPLVGQGRELGLHPPYLKFNDVLKKVRKHLRQPRIRVAAHESHRKGVTVEGIAVCAGAGASVLKESRHATVWLTGEMRHHDILAANARGISVILCDHTNTERGYLPILKNKLHEKLGQSVRIDISRADREPLQIV